MQDDLFKLRWHYYWVYKKNYHEQCSTTIPILNADSNGFIRTNHCCGMRIPTLYLNEKSDPEE